MPQTSGKKISLDFLEKTGSSEGAELIIFHMSCGVKKITTINSAGNGNATCLYHHLSGSQASTTTETYLAISQGASLDILFKYMLYKPNGTKCLNSGISRCCFSG